MRSSLVLPSSCGGLFCGSAVGPFTCVLCSRWKNFHSSWWSWPFFTAHSTFRLLLFCSLVDTLWISFFLSDIQLITNLFCPLLCLVPFVVHFYHEAKKLHSFASVTCTQLQFWHTHTHTITPQIGVCFPRKQGVHPCKCSLGATKNLTRPIRERKD